MEKAISGGLMEEKDVFIYFICNNEWVSIDFCAYWCALCVSLALSSTDSHRDKHRERDVIRGAMNSLYTWIINMTEYVQIFGLSFYFSGKKLFATPCSAGQGC